MLWMYILHGVKIIHLFNKTISECIRFILLCRSSLLRLAAPQEDNKKLYIKTIWVFSPMRKQKPMRANILQRTTNKSDCLYTLTSTLPQPILDCSLHSKLLALAGINVYVKLIHLYQYINFSKLYTYNLKWPQRARTICIFTYLPILSRASCSGLALHWSQIENNYHAYLIVIWI